MFTFFIHFSSFASAGTPPPWGKGVIDPLKTKPPPHVCYHEKVGISTSKRLCINRSERIKMESVGASVRFYWTHKLKTKPLTRINPAARSDSTAHCFHDPDSSPWCSSASAADRLCRSWDCGFASVDRIYRKHFRVRNSGVLQYQHPVNTERLLTCLQQK